MLIRVMTSFSNFFSIRPFGSESSSSIWKGKFLLIRTPTPLALVINERRDKGLTNQDFSFFCFCVAFSISEKKMGLFRKKSSFF